MTPGTDHIYLDHNATTPMLPQVAEAMVRASSIAFGNPASQHWAGRKSRQILEDARDCMGSLLGADARINRADRVIFTSGGTEANNLALFGLSGDSPGHVIISAIEHPSVVGPAEELRRRGWRIELLPVTADGVSDLGGSAGSAAFRHATGQFDAGQ